MGNVRDEGLRGIRLSVVTQSIPEVLTFYLKPRSQPP
jgi:hypothetical protein